MMGRNIPFTPVSRWMSDGGSQMHSYDVNGDGHNGERQYGCRPTRAAHPSPQVNPRWRNQNLACNIGGVIFFTPPIPLFLLLYLPDAAS